MRRQVLRGVLSGLAALVALYVLGGAGLLVEWLTGRQLFDGALALAGIVAALCVGVAMLRRLGHSADISKDSDNRL
jgi:hypothetical protein